MLRHQDSPLVSSVVWSSSSSLMIVSCTIQTFLSVVDDRGNIRIRGVSKASGVEKERYTAEKTTDMRQKMKGAGTKSELKGYGGRDIETTCSPKYNP